MATLLVAATLALPGFHVYGAPPGGGTLLKGVFPGGERRGFVFLPPGFTVTQRYPVLYLLHGMPGDPSEYTDSLGLARQKRLYRAEITLRSVSFRLCRVVRRDECEMCVVRSAGIRERNS